VLFIIIFIIVFILLFVNIFLAIVLDTYSEVKGELEARYVTAEVPSFVGTSVKVMRESKDGIVGSSGSFRGLSRDKLTAVQRRLADRHNPQNNQQLPPTRGANEMTVAESAALEAQKYGWGDIASMLSRLPAGETEVSVQAVMTHAQPPVKDPAVAHAILTRFAPGAVQSTNDDAAPAPGLAERMGTRRRRTSTTAGAGGAERNARWRGSSTSSNPLQGALSSAGSSPSDAETRQASALSVNEI
jgi:hypothetical protein